MMKQDEKLLLKALLEIPDDARYPYKFARDLGLELGLHWKRTAYLCEKWTRKGWWEYGVSVDLGWFTPEGRRDIVV